MSKTSIEWTDYTWSPIRARVKDDAAQIAKAKGYTSLIQIAKKMAGHVGPHCEHVSEGCKNCYAGTNNHRCLPSNGTGLPFDRRSRDLVDAILDEKILLEPLRWKKPRRVFVENQSDLFGEWVPDVLIDRVVGVMAWCRQHTFQVLTKRADRLLEYSRAMMAFISQQQRGVRVVRSSGLSLPDDTPGGMDWPLPNVQFGVSVEDKKTADERITLLLRTPAALRFVSYEPALGPVDLTPYIGANAYLCDCGWHKTEHDLAVFGRDRMCLICKKTAKRFPPLDWVIAGGESGPGARPAHPQWFRDVRDQCQAASVPFFFKQWGAYHPADAEQGTVTTKDGEVLQSVKLGMPSYVGKKWDDPVQITPEGKIVHDSSSQYMVKVGKKNAGALLDGREWREFPRIAQ